MTISGVSSSSQRLQAFCTLRQSSRKSCDRWENQKNQKSPPMSKEKVNKVLSLVLLEGLLLGIDCTEIPLWSPWKNQVQGGKQKVWSRVLRKAKHGVRPWCSEPCGVIHVAAREGREKEFCNRASGKATRTEKRSDRSPFADLLLYRLEYLQPPGITCNLRALRDQGVASANFEPSPKVFRQR